MSALLLAALLAAPAPAQDAAKPSSDGPIKQYYQEALEYYARNDYRRAVGKWNEVLKADPSQKTAQAMILEARKKILVLTRKRRERTGALIAKGEYRGALLELQALLDQDPGDPAVTGVQAKLEEIIKLAARLPPADKPARMAVLGLEAWLAVPPNGKLAYDALRYSEELRPDERTRAFLKLVLAETPSLAEDQPTPGMRLLEYKQTVALHDIYDGKYYRAIATLDAILALEPDDLLALKRLGTAYYSLGRKETARRIWKRALALSPGDRALKKFLAKTANGKDAPSTP